MVSHLFWIAFALFVNRYTWFAGEQLSMADIQMSFPLFALLARGGIAHLDHINAWKARVEMRPAWQRAIQQGGPFTIPGG